MNLERGVRMGVLEGIVNFLLAYLIVNGIFNYLAFTRARKAAQQAQAEKEQAAINLEVKEEIEMVRDNICGCTLPKSEAYVLFKNEIKHYFCSWNCREKYIADNQM